MPMLMSLEGPRLGAIQTPRSKTLKGVADTIMQHPWVAFLGLLAGGWLASKYAPTWGKSWGHQRMAYSRERSMHGLGMTKAEAYRQFKELYPPDSFRRFHTHAAYGGKSTYVDKPMRAEAWNNYTDSLAKDGEITMKQYESWTHPWKDR
jgi:hypothetical protein